MLPIVPKLLTLIHYLGLEIILATFLDGRKGTGFNRRSFVHFSINSKASHSSKAGPGIEKKKKEVSSAVTVPNNKAPEGAEDGSIDGKRPDLGILITGLPARSSGRF